MPRENWTTSSLGDDIMSAEVGCTPLRQLYVVDMDDALGDEKLVRARTPNIGFGEGTVAPRMSWISPPNEYYQVTIPADILSTAEGAVALGSGMEIVIPIGWAISRLRVLAYSTTGATTWVSPFPEEGAVEHSKPWGPFHSYGQGFFLENAAAFLDAPGEWFLERIDDRSRCVVHVWPESPDDLDGIVIPGALETMLVIDGASHLSFEGLQLSHTGWSWADEHGYVGVASQSHLVWDGDAGVYDYKTGPFAVEVSGGADDIELHGCRITQLGAGGVRVSESSNIGLLGNIFALISGAALALHGPTDGDGGVSVEDNLFTDIGYEYAGDAIMSHAVENAVIEHNHLQRIAGRGLYAIDASFDARDPRPRSNRFSHNFLYHVVSMIIDAGAVNTGGRIGFDVFENAIRSVRPAGWSRDAGHTPAVYLDIGSYDIHVRDNGMEDVETSINLNCQAGNVVRDNQILDAERVEPRVTYAACVVPEGFPWSEESNEINRPFLDPWMEASGCDFDVPTPCVCNADDDQHCQTDTIVENDGEGSSLAATVWTTAGLREPYRTELSESVQYGP